MDPDAYDRTVQVALDGGIISAEPTEGAYRTDLAEAAVAALTEQGVDVEASRLRTDRGRGHPQRRVRLSS